MIDIEKLLAQPDSMVINGPFSLDWIIAADRAPGSLRLAVVIRILIGLQKGKQPVEIPLLLWNRLRIGPEDGKIALATLQAAGLIRVDGPAARLRPIYWVGPER